MDVNQTCKTLLGIETGEDARCRVNFPFWNQNNLPEFLFIIRPDVELKDAYWLSSGVKWALRAKSAVPPLLIADEQRQRSWQDYHSDEKDYCCWVRAYNPWALNGGLEGCLDRVRKDDSKEWPDKDQKLMLINLKKVLAAGYPAFRPSAWSLTLEDDHGLDSEDFDILEGCVDRHWVLWEIPREAVLDNYILDVRDLNKLVLEEQGNPGHAKRVLSERMRKSQGLLMRARSKTSQKQNQQNRPALGSDFFDAPTTSGSPLAAEISQLPPSFHPDTAQASAVPMPRGGSQGRARAGAVTAEGSRRSAQLASTTANAKQNDGNELAPAKRSQRQNVPPPNPNGPPAIGNTSIHRSGMPLKQITEVQSELNKDLHANNAAADNEIPTGRHYPTRTQPWERTWEADGNPQTHRARSSQSKAQQKSASAPASPPFPALSIFDEVSALPEPTVEDQPAMEMDDGGAKPRPRKMARLKQETDKRARAKIALPCSKVNGKTFNVQPSGVIVDSAGKGLGYFYVGDLSTTVPLRQAACMISWTYLSWGASLKHRCK